MIYLDTSVALAELLGEKKRPPLLFWAGPKVSSRLLEYEVLVRHHALRRPPKAIRIAQDFLTKVQLIDLDASALGRALKPFPISVRTLDAIHLSTIVFLQGRGITLELATYDKRMAQAAAAIGISIAAV